ncbi:MAG: fibronectin type III domain-containing protein [Clostridia bacterium]|nr:fibronectin type III domain-containing protein [Clostridia bacterium]
MKSIIKRFIALVMAIILCLGLYVPTTMAAGEKDLPIIFIYGKGNNLYDKNGVEIFPLKSSVAEAISDNMSAIVADAATGVLTDNWAPLGNTLYKAIAPVFEKILLDENGEISNGSYHKKSTAPKVKKSGFALYDYVFLYDWRVDPAVSAKQLDEYINAVLKATGKSKVQIMSRCYGTNVAASYLTIYGGEKVDTCILYAGSCNGILPVSAFFTGNIYLDPAALKRYASTTASETEFADAIKILSDIMNSSSLISSVIESNINDAVNNFLPRLLLATYATFPGYWSMVNDQSFEEAKSFVFGANSAKYQKLIEKADDYHYNVQVNLPSTLKKLSDEGLNVVVIGKYNFEMAPIYKNSNLQSDDTVELNSMCFGSIAADFGETLPSSYVQSVKDCGLEAYISPDNIIDASTCLFPETTWFIKDAAHTVWPTCVNDFMMKIFRSKTKFTINSSKDYPQFLQYNKKINTLSPVSLTSTAYLATLSQTSYSYDGKVKSPSVSVKIANGTVLKSGTDYRVTYESGRKNIGSYDVTITFRGNYSNYPSTVLKFDIVPQDVSGVTVSTSSSAATIKWNPVSNSQGYKIYSYNTKTGQYTLLGTTAETSFKAKKLASGTTYVFCVKAYKNASGIDYTSKNYSKVTTTTEPGSPTVSATSKSGYINLSWSKVTGATGYIVYVSSKKSSGYKKIGSTKEKSFKYTSVTPGKTYYFRVKAYKKLDGVNYYGKSVTVSAFSAPAKPTLSFSRSTTRIRVKWNKLSGATGYQVYMSTTSNGNYIKLGSVKTNEFLVTGLTPGQTYFFKVRGYKKLEDGVVYGSFSKIKTATKPSKVSDIETSAGKKKATLSWGKVYGAAAYEIFVSTNKTSGFSKLKTTDKLTFTATGLKAKKTYYFKIRAYKSLDGRKIYSDYSKVYSVKTK